jgi:hypothetical protein
MDCHNPHLATGEQTEAPYVSGMMTGVSGVDRNGVGIDSARYEYEVCFKCHADNTPDFSYIPRVQNNTNNRLDLDPNNSSFHPIVAIGKNPNVPSIPSSLEPAMTPFDYIYCKSCHADDEGGSSGPHGSAFPPILRERYETTDGTAESFENYALCYRCHERNSILRNDSFQQKMVGHTTPSGGGHSGHLAAGATCSECHDPHGVYDWGVGQIQDSGSHTNLINFDTRIVAAKSGATYPIFVDTGVYSGRCDLVCHGVTHDGWSYP